jgi:glycosyltransferase involved in cell wall biosynthesis
MMHGWLVMPAYNEAQGIAAQLELLGAFLSEQARQSDVHFTILVVNDGSSDDTRARVLATRSRLEALGVDLRYREFARNFGHQAAIVAGLLEAATGADFAITLDADGEHPVAVIPALIAAWCEGAPLVHTIRRSNRQLGAFKRSASTGYYVLLSRISGVRIGPGMADFKLWDGALLREVRAYLPNCGSTRVFAAWIAPFAPTVEYEQAVVEGRRSRFTLRKNVSLALAGLIRYTDAPLRLSLLMSLFAGVVAASHSAFALWSVYSGHAVPGWATIVIIVAFFGALQSFSIGILGEYLLRISFRSSLPAFVMRRSASEAQTGNDDFRHSVSQSGIHGLDPFSAAREPAFMGTRQNSAR